MKLTKQDTIWLNRKLWPGQYNITPPIGGGCSIRDMVLKQCFVATQEKNGGISGELKFKCYRYFHKCHMNIVRSSLEQ